jgi:hypothetical protein
VGSWDKKIGACLALEASIPYFCLMLC